jgi:hypothetical protein
MLPQETLIEMFLTFSYLTNLLSIQETIQVLASLVRFFYPQSDSKYYKEKTSLWLI